MPIAQRQVPELAPASGRLRERLVSVEREDHAASIVNDFDATLGEALQYTATVTPASFPTLMKGLDPGWID